MGEELGITASESDQLYVSLSSQHCVSLSLQCSPPPLHNMTVAQRNLTSSLLHCSITLHENTIKSLNPIFILFRQKDSVKMFRFRNKFDNIL